MMKRSLLLYSFAVAILSLVALWLFSFILAPKVEAIFREVGGREAYLQDAFLRVTLQTGLKLYPYFWALAGFTLLLFIPSWIPSLPDSVRRGAHWALGLWSLLLLIYAGCGLVASCGGAFQADHARRSKMLTYERVMQEYSIKEAAEARHEEVLRRLTAFWNRQPIPIQSANELTSSERRARIGMMISLLKRESGPDLKKRLLATVILFRESIVAGSDEEKVVQQTAQELTAESFTSAEDFFKWLEPKLGQEGWEPVPLYR